jgi:hypothetical protein
MSQSGGIAGVALTVEVSSQGQLRAEDQRSGRSVTETLPPEAIAQLRHLVSETIVRSSPAQRPSCQDCFIYDLGIQANASSVSIHADDITLNDSGAASLIELLRKLRDSVLGSQP